MRTIWKFPFSVIDQVALVMPKDAQILAVQAQGEMPCLWALVDSAADTCVRRFRVFGTGHPVDEADLAYIGMFQMHGGSLVFHLFERKGGAS